MADRRNASAPTASRAGVLRPEEFARHVRLERADCTAALAPWVENYWSLRWDLPAGTTFESSTLPHPACNLSLEHGAQRAGAQRAGSEQTDGDAPVVTGVVTRRFDVTVRGSGWVHAAKFRPGGLAALTGIHARDLRDATVPAEEVLDRPTIEALGRVRDAGDDPAAAHLVLDEVLAAMVGTPDDDYLLVLDVVGAMLADRSLVRVAQVEERCGVGTRTLQRLFARYVGVSPKWVLSRYRIHDVVSELDAGHVGSLAELAASYGWFDQAHFTREFTDLVGVPPGAYQRRATGAQRW